MFHAKVPTRASAGDLQRVQRTPSRRVRSRPPAVGDAHDPRRPGPSRSPSRGRGARHAGKTCVSVSEIGLHQTLHRGSLLALRWRKRTHDPLPSGVFGRGRTEHTEGAVQDADHTGWMPASSSCSSLLVLAGCGGDDAVGRRRRPRSPRPAPPGSPLGCAAAKDNAIPAFRQQQYEQWLRAEIARTRRSPTVEASLRRRNSDTGISRPAFEASLRKDWANANRPWPSCAGVRRMRAGLRDRHDPHAAAAHMLTARPAATHVPGPAHQHPLLGDTAAAPPRASGRARHADPRSSSTTRATACSSSRWRAGGGRTRSPAPASAALRSPHQAGTAAARARRGQEPLDRLSGAGRASRSGYLACEYYFALRDRLAAVGERDDAGDGDRRRSRAATARWARSAGGATALAALRRVREGAAERRVGARARRAPLPPVLVRARLSGLQRRPAGRDRPARHRRAAALQPRREAVPSAASGRRGGRSPNTTPAPGRCTPSTAPRPRSADHALIAGFLANLCDRAHRQVYCSAGKRVQARYEREPTKIGLAPLQGSAGTARARSASRSRRSRPSRCASGARAGSACRATSNVSRGVQRCWRGGLGGRGRYRLRITAQGPSGPLGVETRTIRVDARPSRSPRRRRTGGGRRPRRGSATAASDSGVPPQALRA